MRKEALFLMGMVCGCFDLGSPPPLPEVVATSVDGEAGLAPTGAIAVTLSLPIDPETISAVVLVRGEAEGALIAALDKPPPAARFLSRLVAVRAEVQGETLLMTPRRALEEGARYTLVVGAALRAGDLRLGRPAVRAFTTGSLAEAAPILSLVDPPDGAAGVVRNLREIRVAWSKPMPRASFEVVRDDGVVWPSVCDDQLITLGKPLDADRRWQVVAHTADADGRPPFGDPPGFSTGSELRTQAPRLDGLQLEAADTCLVARFATSRATFVELCVADRCRADHSLSTGLPLASATHALGTPLDDPKEVWTLRVWDESTAPEVHEEGEVRRPAVPLVLTEVLSEPRGPRTTQQFIELLNIGVDPVDLGGLALCTASGCDILPQSLLPSGGYAVVVGSSYADDGLDARPLSGSLVVKVANQRLGGRGIRSGGEPVWLEGPDGTLITRWGGWPASVKPGESLSRQPYNCDLPASFRPGPATPGGP